jgi:hypothetical protein
MVTTMGLFNWSQLVADAPEMDFSLLPDDKYPLKISKVEIRTSTNTGKTGFNITCDVISGEHKNRKLFHTFWLSPENPKAMGFFFADMGNLGIPRNFFLTNPSNETLMTQLKGRTFLGKVGTEEYNGKESNKIQNISKLETVGGAGPAGGPPAPAGMAPAPTGMAPAPTAAPAPTPEPALPAATAPLAATALVSAGAEAPVDPF